MRAANQHIGLLETSFRLATDALQRNRALVQQAGDDASPELIAEFERTQENVDRLTQELVRLATERAEAYRQLAAARGQGGDGFSGVGPDPLDDFFAGVVPTDADADAGADAWRRVLQEISEARDEAFAIAQERFRQGLTTDRELAAQLVEAQEKAVEALLAADIPGGDTFRGGQNLERFVEVLRQLVADLDAVEVTAADAFAARFEVARQEVETHRLNVEALSLARQQLQNAIGQEAEALRLVVAQIEADIEAFQEQADEAGLSEADRALREARRIVEEQEERRRLLTEAISELASRDAAQLGEFAEFQEAALELLRNQLSGLDAATPEQVLRDALEQVQAASESRAAREQLLEAARQLAESDVRVLALNRERREELFNILGAQRQAETPAEVLEQALERLRQQAADEAAHEELLAAARQLAESDARVAALAPERRDALLRVLGADRVAETPAEVLEQALERLERQAADQEAREAVLDAARALAESDARVAALAPERREALLRALGADRVAETPAEVLEQALERFAAPGGR